MQDVGSTTTIVVEMLKAANVPITDAEATLFAIGIHADTGPSGNHLSTFVYP
jgi:nanoRNase/pAp phosphatase (c-di-AMP/oligoRNAs hydrolase)